MWVGGRRGSRLRLGAGFGVPSTPEEPARAPAERGREEGGKEFGFFGGKKRQQASPRCGFRVPSTPEEPARAPAERGGRGGRKKEEGI
jgi:hypothetical protein